MSASSKIAVVSGASRGIGKAIAGGLCRLGWNTFVTGRTEADVNSSCSEMKDFAGKPLPFVGDLTKLDEIKKLAEEVKSKGSLELVVCNLGGGGPDPALFASTEEMRRILDFNFFSAVSLCEVMLPLMKVGNIIFISSIAGCESMGAPVSYSVAKAAMLAYSKGLSDLLSSKGIRVNSISPGNILFPGGLWEKKTQANPERVQNLIKDKVPLQRFGKPEEIFRGVEFILNNDFYTGQNLVIDGGQVRDFL